MIIPELPKQHPAVEDRRLQHQAKRFAEGCQCIRGRSNTLCDQTRLLAAVSQYSARSSCITMAASSASRSFDTQYQSRLCLEQQSDTCPTRSTSDQHHLPRPRKPPQRTIVPTPWMNQTTAPSGISYKRISHHSRIEGWTTVA